MILKEKCIYYNPTKDGYYLVLSVSKEMIRGRYGKVKNPNFLDTFMNQEDGLKFKIDDIFINMESCRNYMLNDEGDNKDLDNFILVRELTDEEFYPMELLINSNYKFPEIVIDVHKHMNDVSNIVTTIRELKSERAKLSKDICELEKKLFMEMRK